MNNIRYKISEFAAISGVTPKALRYYEKKELLKPSFIDTSNGYRYYCCENTSDIIMIRQLQELGFTINEIKRFTSNGYSIENKIKALEMKKEKLEQTLNLCKYQQDKNFKHSATIKCEPAFYCYKKSVKAPATEELFAEYTESIKEIKSKGITLSFPHYAFIEFLDENFCETDISAILCTAVSKKEDKSIVLMPPQTYITSICIGDYSNLKETYEFLFDYLKLKGLEISGYPSERYLITAYYKDDPNNYITEVRFPIASDALKMNSIKDSVKESLFD